MSLVDDSRRAPVHPAATVILLRDRPGGCEVLLLRRNRRLVFHGGAWVFPGGRIDPDDHVRAASADPARAAWFTAVRETFEESGLAVSTDDLVPVSRWVTPEYQPKRFDAWFFAARSNADDVRVDGGEIHGHRWIRPQEAIRAQGRGEIELPPPTYVTLHHLDGAQRADEAIRYLVQQSFPTFYPRLQLLADGACSLYPGDGAYDDGEIDRDGPRHRLWMRERGWCYERTEAWTESEARNQEPE